MERHKLTVKPLFFTRLFDALMAEQPQPTAKTEQNCAWRLDFDLANKQWVRVKQFSNGTLYLEGSATELFTHLRQVVQRVIGGTSSQPVSNSPVKSSPATKTAGEVGLTVPYIGTDESGKGDYFGALVVAGAFVTPEQAQQLEGLGVQDSKNLQPKQISALAAQIRQHLGSTGYKVITISPERYNQLYASFKQRKQNLNHLLAWGHAKVIEELLGQHPTCTHVIADQFGSEHYIRNQLQTLGKQATLIQTHKAEANTGVAAASILARDACVQYLYKLSEQWQMTLPLGAGDPVLRAAKQFVKMHSANELTKVAKTHFKTTEQVT